MNLVTALALFWDTLSEAPGGHEKGLRGFSGAGAGEKRRLTGEKENNSGKPDDDDDDDDEDDHDGVGEHEDDDDDHGGISPSMLYAGEQEKGEKEKETKNNEGSDGGGQGDDGAGPSHGYVCDLFGAKEHTFLVPETPSLPSSRVQHSVSNPSSSCRERKREHQSSSSSSSSSNPAKMYKPSKDSIVDILEAKEDEWCQLELYEDVETLSEGDKESLEEEFKNIHEDILKNAKTVLEEYNKNKDIVGPQRALEKVHRESLHCFHEARGYTKQFLERHEEYEGKLATQYRSHSSATQDKIQERMIDFIDDLKDSYLGFPNYESESESDSDDE